MFVSPIFPPPPTEKERSLPVTPVPNLQIAYLVQSALNDLLQAWECKEIAFRYSDLYVKSILVLPEAERNEALHSLVLKLLENDSPHIATSTMLRITDQTIKTQLSLTFISHASIVSKDSRLNFKIHKGLLIQMLMREQWQQAFNYVCDLATPHFKDLFLILLLKELQKETPLFKSALETLSTDDLKKFVSLNFKTSFNDGISEDYALNMIDLIYAIETIEKETPDLDHFQEMEDPKMQDIAYEFLFDYYLEQEDTISASTVIPCFNDHFLRGHFTIMLEKFQPDPSFTPRQISVPDPLIPDETILSPHSFVSEVQQAFKLIENYKPFQGLELVVNSGILTSLEAVSSLATKIAGSFFKAKNEAFCTLQKLSTRRASLAGVQAQNIVLHVAETSKKFDGKLDILLISMIEILSKEDENLELAVKLTTFLQDHLRVKQLLVLRKTQEAFDILDKLHPTALEKIAESLPEGEDKDDILALIQ